MSLPRISQLEFAPEVEESNESQSVHKTFAWDFEQGDFKLDGGRLIEIEGVEYLRIWIEKTLRTIKNTHIYQGKEYGSDHHSLVGTTFKPSFTESEFRRMISECLLQNNAITDVSGFRFRQSGSRLRIEFNVVSVYGTSKEVVLIDE